MTDAGYDIPRLPPSSARRGSWATVLVRAAEAAAVWLRPGGGVLLELGGDQADEVATALVLAGLSEIRMLRDEDGQDRAIEARSPDRPASER